MWWCCTAVRWRRGGLAMHKPFTSCLPSHDGQRGAVIKWPQDCQLAFEIGFLGRVHPRLCSPFGGAHQARQTCLQL